MNFFKENKMGIFITFAVILFLITIVTTRLYKMEDLPIQTIGALLGSVVTALITYYLLIGQTKSEEKKERNVKVYEKKTEIYEPIIKHLWQIWEDKQVSRDEVKNLFDNVLQNVVLYMEKDKIKTILNHIEILTVNANKDNTSQNSEVIQKQSQNSIIAIINVLAEDISLGGELDDETQSKINLINERLGNRS